MILNLSPKELIIFLSLLVLEYFILYLYFGRNQTHSKFILIFILFLTIKYLNKNFVFINNIYILLLISFFYYTTKKQEGFTSKLKSLKDKNKYDEENSNLNDTKIKNKKETFKSTENISIGDYYNSFEDYKFTKSNKSVFDSINKFPFYKEKFKEIFS